LVSEVEQNPFLWRRSLDKKNRDAPSNEDKPSRRRLIGLAIAGAILLVVFLWVWVHPTNPTEKKDFIQAVGVLLAALAALGGLYFTRTSTKDQLEQARKSQEQTQRLTEQGQITDRFTRAIDQLGKVDENNNKLFEIRIGGIYALQRIARESEKDYGPIMEILTAYVREHAPWPPKEEVEEGKPPEADIQAILTVIGRRERYPGHRESVRLDLQGTNLRRSSALSEAHLAGAYFMGANLSNVVLNGANLSGADLSEADLSRANLSNAVLNGANLSGADLLEADLSRANLKGADLSNAILAEADLSEADLSEADIGGADLSGANLRKAHFSEATILWDADIRGAIFSETDPRTMRRHLESARGDETTRLPPGLKPDELWDGKTDEH
jgi:hypothetical protein